MCLICGCKKSGDYTKLQGIQKLNCSYCSLLTEIPLRWPGGSLEGLQILICSCCPLLKEIPKISTLEEIYCNHCASLTKIPKFPNLKTLFSYRCPRLIEIPDNLNASHSLQCWGSPWIKPISIKYPNWTLIINEQYSENISNLVKLQKFWRKTLKYFRFKRWIKSQEFASFFYAPENFGGYKTKLQLNKHLNNIKEV